MITSKPLREVTDLNSNSRDGTKPSRPQEQQALPNFMKKFTLKLERTQLSPRKLPQLTPKEITKNSSQLDLLVLKDTKMSRRESKSDLRNSRKPKRNDELSYLNLCLTLFYFFNLEDENKIKI